jgi:hypothetical protein
MKKGLIIVGVLLSLFCLLLFGASLGSETNRHVEDFTTTQYKDLANTTAWWDTIAGELKLPLFVPTLDGSYHTPGGYARGVAISGDYAYMADGGTTGLQVIDISDPEAPSFAGSCATPGSARGVAISGDYAYVADYGTGLQVIDISDPMAPALVGSYYAPGGYARGVAISGDYAYMADGGSNGLQVIDISDPTAPAFAGSYVTPGSAWGVAISGDYAYVADYGTGLQVIDISDPTVPTLAGSYDTPGQACGVAISGDHAYVADEVSGLQVIDISDPTAPAFAGSYDTPGQAYGVAISGDHAYVADEVSGLQVIDISDPMVPTYAGSYDTPDNALTVAISGDYAYVADAFSGLQVIDISDPEAPSFASDYDTPGAAYGVAISGDYAYVADYTSGLQAIDISDPTVPAYAGSYDTPGRAFGVAISGDHAYVADETSGLQVIDISDPTVPTYAGSYNTPGAALGVAISGDYAYVADHDYGLQVIDISDPTVPTYAGSYDTPGSAVGVAISGDYAYVADASSGLQVIDISDPTVPTYAGSYDTPGSAYSVAISGDYAYVADYTSGLQAIDISDPTVPTYAGSYDTPGYAWRVAISGDYTYVAAYTTGLQVIKVFQREVGIESNVGWSLAVDASNDTICWARLTTTQTGAVTWELSADGGTSWEGISPDGIWNHLTQGIDLLWRSTHVWTPVLDPTVTQLEIEWLVESALIDSIVDVPDDQGGWVRAHFTRSGRDFPEEATLPIASYGVWRWVESVPLLAALEAQASPQEEKRATGGTPELTGMPVVTYMGKTYIQSSPDLAAFSFPPGTWELVISVPAVQQDDYIVAVPTLADSSVSGTNYTVFVVTAHTTTPSIWYASEPDSGYSVDNIAPGVPTGLMVAYNTGSGTELIWDECPDDDFQYFRIYRGESEDFEPEPENLVHSTAETEWLDTVEEGWRYYYKVTALDYAGNESEAASPETVTGGETPQMPRAFALHQNVPNPFNPVTTIRFDLPRPSHVRLNVYNVKGELVATLVDGYMTEGRKGVGWEARDDEGRSVASGVYFYRLTAGDFVQTRKMVLLR